MQKLIKGVVSVNKFTIPDETDRNNITELELYNINCNSCNESTHRTPHEIRTSNLIYCDNCNLVILITDKDIVGG